MQELTAQESRLLTERLRVRMAHRSDPVPVTDGLPRPIFAGEVCVAYVLVTVELAEFYVPFVCRTEAG